MPTNDGLTAAEVAEEAARHWPRHPYHDDAGQLTEDVECAWCGEEWPCDWQRFLATLAAAQAQVAAIQRLWAIARDPSTPVRQVLIAMEALDELLGEEGTADGE